ncbi:hypothetical protein JCM17380_03030 [Desulfosporosinus burensis]
MNGKQVFNIFKDNPLGAIFGSFAFDEPNNLKKEAASFSGKPPLAASDADILAREAGSPEMGAGHISRLDFGDVACKPFILLHIKYSPIAFIRIFVDFTMSDAFHAAGFKSRAKAPDT